MKKLIVIGIVAAMVMGLSAVAFATGDNWTVYLHAGTDTTGVDGLAASKFGIKTIGSTDTYTQISPPYVASTPEINEFDSTHAWAGKGTDPRYTIVNLLKGAGKDPSVAPVEYDFWVVGPASTTINLYAWNPTGTATDWDGTKFNSLVLWTVTSDGSMKSNPYTFDFNANGGNDGSNMTGTYATRTFTIDANGDPQRFALIAGVPEPGSFVALFSGIVGLVGFGIRRRR
jgi:hypothetical protein